ncbi:MAG: serine/threonine protein kinase, partial [Acidobacteria bacterium]|nr:serine/threonine protein kinase [Acidobacteriota bacterium]
MNQKRPSDPGAADGARLDPIPMDQASAAVLTPKPAAAVSVDATLPMSPPAAAAMPGVAYGMPAQIGRYQILDRVGQGGMGVLYRAIDPALDREVAIKLMLGDFADDIEQLRPRFQREARAIAKLQHRNIVTVFEFAEDAGVPYIVMEFLRGTSLSARPKAEPPLTIVEKLDIVAQLCDGLGYAHEQGIVHRDVKPANILLLGDGSVKLLDFGIAKLTTSNLTRQGDVLGSPAYMSPEQIMGEETIDGRSDVFSA